MHGHTSSIFFTPHLNLYLSLPPSPLHRYLDHMRAIQRAYSCLHDGDKYIAMKKAVLILLWYAAGRTGEVALTSWTLNTWDAQFNALVVSWAQMKTSVTKTVTLTAGTTYLTCPFLLLGDLFAMGQYAGRDMDEAEVSYMFPNVAYNKDPSGTVSDMVTDALIVTASKRLAPFAATAAMVPPDVRAESVRHGVAGMLTCMPRVLAEGVTGHTGGGGEIGVPVGNYRGYAESVSNSVAMQVTGSMVVGGWPAPNYGQMSGGPVPASLDVLDFTPEVRDSLIDNYFIFADGLTLPSLLAKGALRPFACAALATAIMWYPERFALNMIELLQTVYAVHTYTRNSGVLMCMRHSLRTQNVFVHSLILAT
jgi:hypothetical protein